MSRGSFYSAESTKCWDELMKVDSCAIPQLKKYADESVATPIWAIYEIERAFHVGFMIAKGTLKLDQNSATPIPAATETAINECQRL